MRVLLEPPRPSPHASRHAPRHVPGLTRPCCGARVARSIWSTGQDQCATIKRQLCLLLPGASVFLDVDDLEDIGLLEEYIEASGVVMIFVSQGYFKSPNCLREVRCAVTKGKPLSLVHDPVRGGASLEGIEAECPIEMRGDMFSPQDCCTKTPRLLMIW